MKVNQSESMSIKKYNKTVFVSFSSEEMYYYTYIFGFRSEDESNTSGSSIDVHSVDIQSETFKNLGVKEKYDVLIELKETRKQNSWGRLNELPKNSDTFSDFQVILSSTVLVLLSLTFTCLLEILLKNLSISCTRKKALFLTQNTPIF